MPTSSAILAQRLKASVDSARDGKLPVLVSVAWRQFRRRSRNGLRLSEVLGPREAAKHETKQIVLIWNNLEYFLDR